MKFTEEQYHEIIEAWDSAYGYEQKTTDVVKLVSIMITITRDDNTQYLEALALANPASRELAHEQFVEKEKKYLWTTPLVAGIKYALIKENGKYVLSDMYLTGKGTPLTELEVVNIGLKTDWFIKEEVE